jgi:hypothetical protein
MPKRILIITDDAGESLEIYYAQQRFTEAGYQAVIAATQKKLLHGVIHDFEPDWNTYVERPGYRIPSDIAFGRVKAADYEAVMLIGGRAPEFLRHDPKAREMDFLHLPRHSNSDRRRAGEGPEADVLSQCAPGTGARRWPMGGPAKRGGRADHHIADLGEPPGVLPRHLQASRKELSHAHASLSPMRLGIRHRRAAGPYRELPPVRGRSQGLPELSQL